MKPHLKPDPAAATGRIEALLDTGHVTEPTRTALRARLAWTASAPQVFGAEDLATLAAICDRLIPQPEGTRRVDLAGRLDARLAGGTGDGWRYDDMPPDRVAFVLGVAAIEATARLMAGAGFRALEPSGQDRVLAAVEDGSAPESAWGALPPRRLFEALLAALVELYYAHPLGQDRIGYVGMADAHGFHALGLNRRDPVEGADAPV